jgi:hypothetical protein
VSRTHLPSPPDYIRLEKEEEEENEFTVMFLRNNLITADFINTRLM